MATAAEVPSLANNPDSPTRGPNKLRTGAGSDTRAVWALVLATETPRNVPARILCASLTCDSLLRIKTADPVPARCAQVPAASTCSQHLPRQFGNEIPDARTQMRRPLKQPALGERPLRRWFTTLETPPPRCIASVAARVTGIGLIAGMDVRDGRALVRPTTRGDTDLEEFLSAVLRRWAVMV